MTTSPYARLFAVLDDVGLRSRSDLRVFRSRTPGAKWASVAGVMDDRDGWVTEAFTAAWELHTPMLERFLAQSSPRLLAGQIWSWGYFNPRFSTDPVIQRRAAYAALFPTRTLVISSPIVAWPDQEHRDDACPVSSSSSAAAVLSWGRPFVPYDFLAQAIELRPLLESGLAYLLPRRFSTEHFGENSGLTQTLDRAEAKTDVELTTVDPSSAAVGAASASSPGVDSTLQILALPWLHGAQLEDVVEVAQQHAPEFERYLSALGRFFSSRELEDLALRGWLLEVQHHIDTLQAQYVKKEKELRRRGRNVTAGLCFTAAPLLAPSTLEPLRDLFAAGWSGYQIADAVGWLRDWRSRESIIADSDFWFAWRVMRPPNAGGRQ